MRFVSLEMSFIRYLDNISGLLWGSIDGVYWHKLEKISKYKLYSVVWRSNMSLIHTVLVLGVLGGGSRPVLLGSTTKDILRGCQVRMERVEIMARDRSKN